MLQISDEKRLSSQEEVVHHACQPAKTSRRLRISRTKKRKLMNTEKFFFAARVTCGVFFLY